MGRKYLFRAPYNYEAYVSLRMESKKFTRTKDGRFVVSQEPLTLNEYYVAFISEVPFRAYVEDRVELLLPDDLEAVVDVAGEVRRGRGRVWLRWWRYEDFDVREEVEIRGRLSGRGIAEVAVKGYGEVRNPYVCDDPDDCMWPTTALVLLYTLTHEYKVLEYRGAATVELAARLLSDPKKELDHVVIHNADVDEVERLMKRAGFEVRRWCREARAELEVGKISENRLYIEC
jgi:hypothetical protein